MFGFSLAADEMAAIDVLNRSQRFITYKGKPFFVKNCRPILYEGRTA